MSTHDIITAVPLAFTDDGALDLAGTRAILQYVAASGVDGALIAGTTGEFPALELAERQAVTELAVEVLTGMRVIIHVGAASTYQAKALIDGARSAGVREIAALTPYYLSVPAGEVYTYYEELAGQAAGLDLYLYLFRDRTGVAVDLDLLARLATLPGVVGVKVSGEPLERIALYRAELPDAFTIYTGADGDFARAADAGANGVISGVASAFAPPFLAMQAALRSGDTGAISRCQGDIDEVVAAIDGSPARMRAVHQLRGLPVGGSRMPIEQPRGEVLARLERAVATFG